MKFSDGNIIPQDARAEEGNVAFVDGTKERLDARKGKARECASVVMLVVTG